MASKSDALVDGGQPGSCRSFLGGYESRMVLVTSLVISILAFDRLSTGYIGPYLIKAFQLTNTELGALYSIQAVAVAVFGYFFGRVSDATGRRKHLLVPMLVIAAICSLGSLLVQTYLMLMVLRLAMGVAMGGISPITQSILSSQSTPSRMGLNIGIQTLLMFLVSQMLGPIIFTRLAASWGWQAAYLASALPFLLMALAVVWTVRDSSPATGPSPATVPAPSEEDPASADQQKTVVRNVWLCIGISSCFMLWLVVHSTFLPLFLVQVRGYSPTEAGAMLSVLGVAGCVGGLGLPMLSDHIGRRAALVVGMALSLVVPLTALFWTGPGWTLSVLFFLGWLSVGTLPIYAVVVPGESVCPTKVAATIALTIGAGEVIGGVAGPLLAGQLADSLGLASLFWFTCGAALTCLVLVMALEQPRERPK